MRRTRSALVGAVLALVAMLGLFALSGWHNAVVHDDDPVHIVSIQHDHGSSKQVDPDGPIHILAHATGQWLGLAATFATPAPLTFAAEIWPARDYSPRSSTDPSELLRPPRG